MVKCKVMRTIVVIQCFVVLFIPLQLSGQEKEFGILGEESNENKSNEIKDERGSIQIKLVNGSKNEEPVAGIEVKLIIYRGVNPVGEESAYTDKDGVYTFYNLEIKPDISYKLKVRYRGIEYSSPLIILSGKEIEKKTTLEVFELSNDPINIKVRRHHLIIDDVGEFLIVQEAVYIYNNSLYVYFSRDESGVSLSLPDNATDVEAGNGVSLKNGKLLIQIPITPRGEQILFRYRVQAKDLPFILNKFLDLPTEKFDLFFRSSRTEVN